MIYDWKRLHDALITLLTVDLGEGFVQGSPVVELRAAEFIGINCPRHQPWGVGGAASVNQIRERRSADTTLLEIEMQSGDTIEIEARDIRCSAPAR